MNCGGTSEECPEGSKKVWLVGGWLAETQWLLVGVQVCNTSLVNLLDNLLVATDETNVCRQ